MAVVSKEEIIGVVASLIGDTPDDNGLVILENLTDTLTHLETGVVDVTEWETKLTELDNSWRKKYKERFLSGDEDVTQEVKDDIEEKDNENLKFEDLFKQAE